MNQPMFRVLYFLGLMVVPAVFGWWMFILMSVLLVYLAKFPFEIIFASIILDAVYYYGDSLLAGNRLLIFSIILLFMAWFLDKKIHWSKII
jgi:hypothetical protein